MSEDKKLEKLFGDALKDFGATPPGGVQNEIKQQLTEKGLLKNERKRRGGFFWLAVLVTAALVTSAVIYLGKNGRENIKTGKHEIENQKSEKSEIEKIAVVTKSENEISASDENKNVVNEKLETGGKKNLVEEKKSGGATVVSEKKVSKKNSGIEKTKNEKLKLQVGKNPHTSVLSASSVFHKKENKNPKTVIAIDDSKSKFSDENISASAKTDSLTGGNENQNQNPTSTAATPISSDTKENSAATAENSSSQNQNVDSTKNVDSTEVASKQNKLSRDTSSTPPILKPERTSVVSMDFSGGPLFSTIKYGNSNAMYQSYINQSRESEMEKVSFAVAFGVNFVWKKFLLESGFKRSVLSSSFSYTEITSQTHYRANNKISFLEVPLLIGYRLTAGKFDVELKAGASLSFATRATTTILSLHTGSIEKYNDLTNSPYRKSNLNLNGAVSFLYNISDKAAIFFQPSFNDGLNSIFEAGYPIEKKIQNYSLGLGFRLKL